MAHLRWHTSEISGEDLLLRYFVSPNTRNTFLDMGQLLALFYVIKIFIYIYELKNTTTHCRSINREHRHNMSIQTHAATPPEEKK